MNFRQLFFQQPPQLVVLLDRLQRLDEYSLPARTGSVHHSLHAPLLLDLHGDDKAFAADGHQFILHRAAFRQPPQVSAQRFLNRAPLLFDLATNARQFGRSLIVQSSIGLNLVAERAQKFGEVNDLVRECPHPVPVGSHICGRMQRDLPPFCRSIHYEDHVTNFRRLQGSSGDARFLDEQTNLDQPGKIKPPAHSPEFPNLAGQFLLALNPIAIRRRSQRGDPLLPERRGGVSAQQLPQNIELQHVRRTMNQFLGHRISWYRSRRSQREWKFDSTGNARERIGEASKKRDESGAWLFQNAVRAQSPTAPAPMAAGSVSAGSRTTNSAPPSRLFRQVIWPLWSWITP